MRILVGLHHVTLGGDTINAVEIAGRLRDRGHAVTLLAFVLPDGSDDEAPLIRLAGQHQLEVRTFVRPSGVRQRIDLIRILARFARAEAFDVVHSFGHQDTYYAFAAVHGLAGVPLIVNDYAMSVTSALPKRVPLIAGTMEVCEHARRARPGPAHLVEPPVDTDSNSPDAVDPAAFRETHKIAPADVLLVVVSRLGIALKSESLRAAIDAVRLLDDQSVRLALVGDGDARTELTERAAKVNAELGREAVILTGALVDPRPAYAAADIVIGMGHSGLRGMSFAKPVVVVGERGFARLLTPDTLSHFHYHGIYGIADGSDMAPRLAAELRLLVDNPTLRTQLGSFGRQQVLERYSLDVAVDKLEAIYRHLAGRRRSFIQWAMDAAYLVRCYTPAKLHRRGR